MQVKSPNLRFLPLLKEQVLDGKEQNLSQFCQDILSGMEQGKILCVRKMGDREVLVLRNLSLWERFLHRCFHWKKQELRQGTIGHFLEKVWDNHQDQLPSIGRQIKEIEQVMARFSPHLFLGKERLIDLSSVQQNLTNLTPGSSESNITLITYSGQEYTLPRSRLETIPFFKALFAASENTLELKKIDLPEKFSDRSLTLLLDLTQGKTLDAVSLEGFDELFLLADFLAFEDLQKSLSATLIEQFKKADIKQKIKLAPLLAKWQGLHNLIAQETVDTLL